MILRLACPVPGCPWRRRLLVRAHDTTFVAVIHEHLATHGLEERMVASGRELAGNERRGRSVT